MRHARKLNRRLVLGLSAGAVAAAAVHTSASAQATVTWKCVANTRLSRQFTVKWKWLADEMGERTKGRMKFDVVSFPELGMTGAELIRVLNAGILDAGEVVTGYVSGEVPIVEGAQRVNALDSGDITAMHTSDPVLIADLRGQAESGEINLTESIDFGR